MKTESYFEEYNKYVEQQSNAIKELEQKRDHLQNSVVNDKQKYKEYVASGYDDEADKLYQVIDDNERQLKAINKRLETKKTVASEVKRTKAVELLKHQSELPKLYEEEKNNVISKLKTVVLEYNKVIDEVNDINDRYEEEYKRYAHLYNMENLYDDKEAKKELNGFFNESLYTSYLNGSILPYEDNKKLKFKK
ncbi:pathogenicity island protein [Staphylococcus pseudintermedius]|uniref:pathogenicity island protein n=1 Tax=Staphylococcus pseudintermedius TaxID=283734 RepID=UPI001C1F9BB4|nr:pathogenicity island protein [Staphylococcus pseudintermedius]